MGDDLRVRGFFLEGGGGCRRGGEGGNLNVDMISDVWESVSFIQAWLFIYTTEYQFELSWLSFTVKRREIAKTCAIVP